MEQATAMLEAPTTSLETALSRTEQEAEEALAAATRVLSAIKAVRNASKVGDLKALHKGMDAVGDVLARAADKVNALRTSWTLSDSEEESLLASGAYTRELLQAAQQAGLGLFPQEGTLACYPSLVKVVPRERAVQIDRKMYRPIRPSHLVAHLSRLQKSTPRFNPAQFLETLYAAYDLKAGKTRGVEKLLDIYRMLTLLPLARKDYSLQEFARDIYLLDGSGEQTTKDGQRLRLNTGATAAKNRANLLVVVTREGIERSYYGIEFVGGQQPWA